MTPENQNDPPTSDPALASASGSTVPFNEATLDKIEKPTLINGLICDLPDNRRVEVWQVKEDDGYCIRIFRPTNDGKTSKLVFGLKPPAAMALVQLLSKQLSNDQAPGSASTEHKLCIMCGKPFAPTLTNRTACKKCLSSCKKKDGRP